HDCSEGGLAVALAEGCVTGREPVGLEAALDASGRGDHVLFGEGPSRVIVAVEPPRVREFEALMAESAIPWRWIGTTGGDRLVLRLGLYALQHRGQESAGIAATDGVSFHTEKAMGWVADVFSPERLRRLPGHRAIGHVRYSTAGSSNIRNAQPITANTARGPVAIAHNGNLTNAETLRRDMERDGAIFQSNSDTEVLLHLLARTPASPLEEQITHALGQVKG